MIPNSSIGNAPSVIIESAVSWKDSQGIAEDPGNSSWRPGLPTCPGQRSPGNSEIGTRSSRGRRIERQNISRWVWRPGGGKSMSDEDLRCPHCDAPGWNLICVNMTHTKLDDQDYWTLHFICDRCEEDFHEELTEPTWTEIWR